MKELYEPALLEHAVINGQNIWHYLFDTTIGEFHLVEHEHSPDPFITDDYIGSSNAKAEKTFKAICTRIINGKD